jgi:xanthine dehydrogenase accessory factor
LDMFETVRRSATEGIAFVLATIVEAPAGVGSKALIRLDGSIQAGNLPLSLIDEVSSRAVQLLQAEESDTIDLVRPDGVYSIFLDVYPGAAQLIIVGASHAAVPLAALAKSLGYAVIVTDARAAFADPSRFPTAVEVIKGWPQDVLPALRLDESTYVVLLTHDPKFDQPTLRLVLPSPVRYIGAIGSRRTQQTRFEWLRAEGFSEQQLARVYGPVGLDLGGRTPEETALAILAEMTAVRHGRSGGHMRSRSPRINAFDGGNRAPAKSDP